MQDIPAMIAARRLMSCLVVLAALMWGGTVPAAGQTVGGHNAIALGNEQRLCVSVAVDAALRRDMAVRQDRRFRRNLTRSVNAVIRDTLKQADISTTLDAGAARVVGRLKLCSRTGDIAIAFRVMPLSDDYDDRPAYRISARIFQAETEMIGHFDRTGFFHAEAGPGGFARRLRRSVERDLKEKAADIVAALLPPDAS